MPRMCGPVHAAGQGTRWCRGRVNGRMNGRANGRVNGQVNGRMNGLADADIDHIPPLRGIRERGIYPPTYP